MADHRHSYSYTKDHSQTPHFSNNLTFSSTLLEEICRSIDHQSGEEELVINSSMRKKRDVNHANLRSVFETEEQMANYQRACMIEKWMDKKVNQKIVVQGKSMADLKVSRKDRQGWSSSSSDSSCGGFFSSSETESFPVLQIPKPVRTGCELGKNHRNSERPNSNFSDESEQKSKRESGLILKTKSRALKMYGDLKKAKQPISPGGKVAAFLNSVFTAANLKKKSKVSSACGGDSQSPSLKSANASTCSSASSFSRSCLSKTTSSSAGKRSVRFSEENNKNDVGFIRSAIDEEAMMMRVMEKNRKLEETARDFLMNYDQKKDQTECEIEFPYDDLGKMDVENGGFDRIFEDDLDAESCASSDLFELENLCAIGMDERYREELPVYETTNLIKFKPCKSLDFCNFQK